MKNLTVHLGSATPFSSRASPRPPVRHSRLPALPATGAHPHRGQRRRCLNNDAPPARATSGSRPTGTRSGRRLSVGARPHDVVLRRVAPLQLDPPPYLFPSLPHRRRSRSKRDRAHSSTPSTPTPLRPLLSSTASLPIVSVPVPLPPATGGLSLASDFTEHRRRLPPLR
jgi:hypothetical protein